MASNSRQLYVPALKEELKNITTLNFISNATTFLEKLLWVSIFIGGSWFIYDVVYNQLDFWNENPVLTTTMTKHLKEINPPAVTFCSKGMQKYGAFERITNYINASKELPKVILEYGLELGKEKYLKRAQMDDFDGYNECINSSLEECKVSTY